MSATPDIELYATASNENGYFQLAVPEKKAIYPSALNIGGIMYKVNDWRYTTTVDEHVMITCAVVPLVKVPIVEVLGDPIQGDKDD